VLLASAPCPDGSARPHDGKCSVPTSGGVPACENGEDRTSEGVCPDVTKTLRMAGGFIAPTPDVKGKAGPLHSPHVPRGPTVIEFSPVQFAKNSAALSPAGMAAAHALAVVLAEQKYADRRFEIAGHTDKGGDPERNLELSKARAQTVRDYLVANGVAADRLETNGYGFAKLKYPEAPYSALNRRVEAVGLN
jgi:outer membrane protein OmpA-like peptidoglycan-associated protein